MGGTRTGTERSAGHGPRMTETELVRRAASGDEMAMHALYRRYAPRVYAVVRRLAGELGIERHLALPGWIAGEEKLALLAEAAVYVLPSYNENLPVIILAALAFRRRGPELELGGADGSAVDPSGSAGDPSVADPGPDPSR